MTDSSERRILRIADYNGPVRVTSSIGGKTRSYRYVSTPGIYIDVVEECHAKTYSGTLYQSSFVPAPSADIIVKRDETKELIWSYSAPTYVTDFATNGVRVYVVEQYRMGKPDFGLQILDADTGKRVCDPQSIPPISNVHIHDGYLYGTATDVVMKWRCDAFRLEHFIAIPGANITWILSLGDYLILFDINQRRNLVYDVYGNCLQILAYGNDFLLGQHRPGKIVDGCLQITNHRRIGHVVDRWRLVEVPPLKRICLDRIRRDGPLCRATTELLRLPGDLQLRLQDLISHVAEASTEPQPKPPRRIYDLRPRKRKINY